MLKEIRTHLKTSTYFNCHSHIKSDGTGAVIVTCPWLMFGFFAGTYNGKLQLSVSTVSRLQRDPINSIRKNIAIRCADIGLSISGTPIEQALRDIEGVFGQEIHALPAFDLAEMFVVEDALQSVSQHTFTLDSVQGSTGDTCFVIEGGESILSVTYRQSHLPILYTHMPDYGIVLRSSVWHRLITSLDIRFHGYENYPKYVDVIDYLEADWRLKQEDFCRRSGCVPERSFVRQAPHFAHAPFFVRDSRKRPIKTQSVDLDVPVFGDKWNKANV